MPSYVCVCVCVSYCVSQVRKMDADHDSNISMSEFLTTLIDWNRMQQEQSWQVRRDCRMCVYMQTRCPCISLYLLVVRAEPSCSWRC